MRRVRSNELVRQIRRADRLGRLDRTLARPFPGKDVREGVGHGLSETAVLDDASVASDCARDVLSAIRRLASPLRLPAFPRLIYLQTRACVFARRFHGTSHPPNIPRFVFRA